MEKAFELADKVDDAIDSVTDYAFDEKYGYLTTCPSNVGTGIESFIYASSPGIGRK